VPHLLVDDVRDHVKLVTLNRPESLNALTYEMLEDLYGLFDSFAHDTDTRVVIITGAGRGWCAGHDVKAHGSGPPWLAAGLGPAQSGMWQQKFWAQAVPKMRAMPQPVIAAINGAVAGGGYAIAMGADLRICTPEAKFRDAFIKTLGASGCEMGLSYLLIRSLGFTRAAELLLTGRDVTGEEAERFGLVNRCVPREELLAAAIALAEEILTNNPFAVWMTKATMWSVLETPSLEAAIDLEARTQILALTTEDQREQSQAFWEKRPSTYLNR
jgi:enoyl-CoA hydratase